MPLAFPCARIVADAGDPTDRAVQEIAGLARDFEAAARATDSVGRCGQLHERLFTSLQLLHLADDVIRARWDALLAKGQDV